MNYTSHCFRAGETIDAIMRLKGRHDYTLEELIILRGKFNQMNGLHVPRTGEVYKIPLLEDPENHDQQPPINDPPINDPPPIVYENNLEVTQRIGSLQKRA